MKKNIIIVAIQRNNIEFCEYNRSIIRNTKINKINKINSFFFIYFQNLQRI